MIHKILNVIPMIYTLFVAELNNYISEKKLSNDNEYFEIGTFFITKLLTVHSIKN